MTQLKKMNFDNLQIDLEVRDPHTLQLWINGEIHENFKAKQIALPSSAKTIINLAGLRSINSLGIREWSQFLHTLTQQTQVLLEECSVVFIDQANIVPQIAANCSIVSFYAPYFCPQCDSELNCKLTFANHKKRLSERRAPQIIHSCGTELEFDALEESFFGFLDRVQADA
jgi:hypothetical protein